MDINIGNMQNVAKFPKLEDYEVRLQTFSGWNNYKNPHELVKSGFYYLGGKDDVQCFFCGLVLRSFSWSYDIALEHKHHSPNCQYLKLEQSNIEKSSIELIIILLNQIREIKDKLIQMEHHWQSGNSKDKSSNLEESMDFYSLFGSNKQF